MNRRLHFAYAWPLKEQATRWQRACLPPPFPDAKPWQCSVYYYWWEYLRRHQGYKATCAAGGIGEFAQLYEDFGDVHSTDFWTWWRTHNRDICRTTYKAGSTCGSPMKQLMTRTVILAVPLDTRLSLTTAQFRRLIEPLTGAQPCKD